jgi:hypothetical protein
MRDHRPPAGGSRDDDARGGEHPTRPFESNNLSNGTNPSWAIGYRDLNGHARTVIRDDSVLQRAVRLQSLTDATRSLGLETTN